MSLKGGYHNGISAINVAIVQKIDSGAVASGCARPADGALCSTAYERPILGRI